MNRKPKTTTRGKIPYDPTIWQWIWEMNGAQTRQPKVRAFARARRTVARTMLAYLDGSSAVR